MCLHVSPVTTHIIFFFSQRPNYVASLIMTDEFIINVFAPVFAYVMVWEEGRKRQQTKAAMRASMRCAQLHEIRFYSFEEEKKKINMWR